MTRTTRSWLPVLLLAAAGAGALAHRLWMPARPPAVTGVATYQCAMHPQIVTHEPGLCPICHMKLQRVDEGGAESPVSQTSDVPGHAPFTLSSERQQLIGVTTARVERRELTRTIRTVGTVAYDPELYQALVDYREAVFATGRDAPPNASAIVRGATLRLRQLGLSPEQIATIIRAGGDQSTLLLPGKTAWVYARVFEYELGLVRPGQSVEITAPSRPGRTYVGQVVAIDPILDATTRSARARVLVTTPDEGLNPEAFVDARLQIPLGRVLAIPDDAVLETGEHSVVFVVHDAGRFEPRAITLGRTADGWHEVLVGLDEGDAIVTSANFLIDSESRFRAALAALAAPAHSD